MRHLLSSPFETDWHRVDYLAAGSARQRQARTILLRIGIHTALRRWHPTLTGTIPLGCDLPASDLDILLQADSFSEVLTVCRHSWGSLSGYLTKTKELRGGRALVVRFTTQGAAIEIVAMQRNVTAQYAYAHMIAEAWLLWRHGLRNRGAIRELKSAGHSTEDAFARHFNLTGDPYDQLYSLYQRERARYLASGA